MVHWKNFIMRGFLLLREFIIGGSTVHEHFYTVYVPSQHDHIALSVFKIQLI